MNTEQTSLWQEVGGHVSNFVAGLEQKAASLAEWVWPFDPSTGSGLRVTGEEVEVETVVNTAEVTEDQLHTAIISHFADDNQLRILEGSGWRRTIASPFHLGDEKNSLDFNVGNGNDDMGKDVFVPADGEVVRNHKDNYGNSTLIIEHTELIQGQEYVWYTKYLHMQNIGHRSGTTITTLNVGDTVTAGQYIGEVGKISDDQSMSAHLHLEVYTMDGNKEKLINLEPVLDQIGVQTTAWDGVSGGERLVTKGADGLWHAQQSTDTGIVFIVDPSPLTDNVDNAWVAWHEDPAQRVRVRWDSRGFWIQKNDSSKKWDISTQTFQSIN